MYHKTLYSDKDKRTADATTKSTGRVYSLPRDQAAIELAKIYHIVSKEERSSPSRKLSDSDKIGNIADAVGSLGMILGAVKMPSGEQNTFTFSVLNYYSLQCSLQW